MDSILQRVWQALALPADSRFNVSVTGTDSLSSRFPVTDLASASIGAAGLATSELLAMVGSSHKAVVVNRHLASAWFGWSIRPLGWALPEPWDAIAGDYRTADGWIRLHTNAPRHRAAALSVLRCEGDKGAVAKAVSAAVCDELERAILDAGGCAAAMHSLPVWREHPQGQAVMKEPLITLGQARAGVRPAWRLFADRPLAGVRVLDLTRVLAGPVATRFLAGLGADVLRIDPPDWDEPVVAPDVTLGKRCARLDLHKSDDRRVFEGLLAEADILVHGYRPGALDRLDYGEARRRSINPDLIDVSLCAYGWTGPWATRRGFDSLVQMSCGIAEAGMRWKQADRPVPLPVQALDHATGYLAATAAIRGLIARLRDDAAMTAKLSLARTAAMLVTSGEGKPGPVFSHAADEDYSTDIEDTPWGPAQRLLAPVEIEGVSIKWDRPASRLNSAEASWQS